MCILPNFEESDLAELKQNRKGRTTGTSAENVKMIVPEQEMLENSLGALRGNGKSACVEG